MRPRITQQKVLVMDTQTSIPTKPITGEELFEMPGADLCELVEGEIKRMSPTGWKHGGVESNLTERLNAFVRENDLGRVLTGEVGIYTGRDPDTVRGADVLFISHERLESASPDGFLDVAPELIVEIMSPTNKWEEVRRKIEEYLAIGVEQVWIVEPANRAVQIYRSRDAVRTLSEDDVLEGEGKLDGFTLPVRDLFAG
jgi:Uma2 family endonuclease